MKLSVYAVLVAVAVSAGAVPHDQEPLKSRDLRYFHAYSGDGQTGAQYTFTESSSDLSEQGWDGLTVSSCSTGWWFTYSEKNFQGYMRNAYYFDHCISWAVADQNVSSLRYGGSPYGLNDNYYNLYDLEWRRGEEFRGNSNMETLRTLDFQASSLIITGQSEWTFFTGEGYTGSAVCVVPTREVSSSAGVVMQHAPFDSMSDLGLPDNSIRSIARGCLSDRVVGAPPFNKTASNGL